MVAINGAESNRASLRYIAEATWGTQPGSGTTKEMRYTSSSLVTGKETQTSNEIRADRMVSNIIEVAGTSSGEINTEISGGSNDDFMQAFLLGAWSKPMNFLLVKGASVAVTGVNQITLSGADHTDWLADGQWVKLEGFLKAANNGYFSINGAPSFSGGNTVIAVDQTVVVEAGSAYTKFMDAGDVIAVSTAISITSGNTVDGGGGNAFGGVKKGQKVFIEGLQKGSGSVVVAATDPTEGATITISDGVQYVVFEVRTDASLVAEGNVHVALSGTEATMAANLRAAIMEQLRQEAFRVSATVSTATVTIKNLRGAGGAIATSNAAAFTVTSFSGGSASKSGVFTIDTVVDNDTFTTTEPLTADANGGGLTVVVKGSHLRNPGTLGDITKQSFTLQAGFEDISKYFLRTGMRVGSFSMSVAAKELVTSSFSLMGGTVSHSSTDLLGNTGTYTVLGTTNTEVFNATANVGAIYKDGSALSSAIRSIELNGDASLREQPAVGSKFPAGIGYGRFMLSGSLQAYFEDFSFYDDFINHTTTSLQFNFEDVDHVTYYYTVPAIKITSDPISPNGIDQDVMEEMEWEAQRDPVLNTQFMIDRFSSVFPSSVA